MAKAKKSVPVVPAAVAAPKADGLDLLEARVAKLENVLKSHFGQNMLI